MYLLNTASPSFSFVYAKSLSRTNFIIILLERASFYIDRLKGKKYAHAMSYTLCFLF